MAFLTRLQIFLLVMSFFVIFFPIFAHLLRDLRLGGSLQLRFCSRASTSVVSQAAIAPPVT